MISSPFFKGLPKAGAGFSHILIYYSSSVLLFQERVPKKGEFSKKKSVYAKNKAQLPARPVPL